MLHLYNSLTKKVDEFKPIKDGLVNLYTCGPTVYNDAHIGNLRSYIFADILKRVLEYNDFQVNQVMNITNVGHLTSDADTGEDKMEKGAKREGKTVWEIAEHYTKSFKNDMQALNILAPSIWCKATDHIKQQIEQIQKIEQNGYTYKTSAGIYFDTSKLKNYGKPLGLDIKGLKEGARVEKDPEKHSPTDFALWKFSPKDKKRQMEWDSPWGKGFPGWHIECSAMSAHYLGLPFDIHTGGVDHIPVHHTNEIAQVEGAEGLEQANWWMHGEFLVIQDSRMAKSEDNFLTLSSLKDKGYDPLAYRYFTFTAHYRKQLNFSFDALDAAANALTKMKQIVGSMSDEPKVGCAEFEQQFLDAINDDLNMPEALAITWNLLKSDYPDHAKKATLLKFDRVLGLGLNKTKKEEPAIPKKIRKLINEREQARKNKNWELSDIIRNQIKKNGFEVEDTQEGQNVKKIAAKAARRFPKPTE